VENLQVLPETPIAGEVPRRLSVACQPIGSLKVDPRNPRLHSRRHVRQLARSIKAFGFNVPISVDANLNVIAGHGRVLACRELGWTEVPTIRLDHLDEAQKRAFMIADNRLTEISQWDDKLLAEQLRDLSLLDLEFSLDATGFEIAEIDLRIDGLNDRPVDRTDRADAVPPVNDGPPISARGDLWVLGRHRIICGDSTDAMTHAALMERAAAAMVFTDPPYNVPIDGHVSGLSSIRHREFARMRRDERSSVHGLPDHSLRPCGPPQPRWRHSLHLHGLAAPWRAARRRHAGLFRAQKHLRVGQAQCRNGFLLPQSARAGVGVQTRPWSAPQ
jgi:hypothetical protein